MSRRLATLCQWTCKAQTSTPCAADDSDVPVAAMPQALLRLGPRKLSLVVWLPTPGIAGRPGCLRPVARAHRPPPRPRGARTALSLVVHPGIEATLWFGRSSRMEGRSPDHGML